MHAEIEKLKNKFVADLELIVARRAADRIIQAFAPALKAEAARKKTERRKAPAQLCPVPSCSNRAAPIFGMVCAKHKDVPKAKIKAYRAARRARKAK